MSRRFLFLCSLLSALPPLAQAAYPYVNNGEKAKAFFQQFQKTSPNDYPAPNVPDINFNVTASTPYVRDPDGTPWWYLSAGAQRWSYTPAITEGGNPNVSLLVDPNGLRYMEQIGQAVNFQAKLGWGYFMIGPRTAEGNDRLFSQDYPSALYANRYSILIQAPDNIVAPDGSVINVNSDPAGYWNTIMLQKGNFAQTDGLGWADQVAENDDWHFYFGSTYGTWVGHPFDVKLEPLGNHFQRITYSDLSVTQRTSAPYLNLGTYGAASPSTRFFDGDDATMLRDETRMYLTSGYKVARFVKTDTTGNSPDIFTKGLRVLHYYGTSFWYEDPGVDVVAFPPSDPEGTPFVQLAADPSVTPTITIPFQIRNHSATDNTYTLFVPFGNTPIWDPTQSDSSGVKLFADDGSGHPGSRLGATVSVAAGGVLKCIMQLTPSMITTRGITPGVADREVSVSLNDPHDPMSLKGASLIVFTYFGSDAATVCPQNIWMYSGFSYMYEPAVYCPANQPPQAIIQASISSNQSVPAGTPIQVSNTGIKPGPATGVTVSNRLYFPDGQSQTFAANGSITYTPWRIGPNQILLESGDGTMRSFDTLNFTVTRGANGPPRAKINVPEPGVTYKAGDNAIFAAWSTLQDNYNPNGGNPGTLYGITNFNWNFGDGTAAVNNEYPVHVFSSPGTYTVTLTVTDDEGRHTSVSQPITITPAGSPPVANIQVVNPQLNRQFGAVELTGAGSTDSYGPGEITQYLWSFTGPNGFTDLDNLTYLNDLPRFLFNAWEAGDYTVNLTVFNQSGQYSSTDTVVNVPAWDGLYRANIISADTGPGGNAGNFDTRVVAQGWPLLNPNQGAAGYPYGQIGLAGAAPVQTQTLGQITFRNTDVPPGTPSNLVGVFTSALGPASPAPTPMQTILDLPRGLYTVKAYMYASNFKTPGTRYTVNFSTLTMNVTIPPNATYLDYILTGTLTHPGGTLLVSGFCYRPNAESICQYTNNTVLSPLAGFTLQPIAGPAPVVSMTSPANNTTTGNPAYLTLSAQAVSQTGTITQVNFYANAVLIGRGTVDQSGTLYTLPWNNVPTGTYSLTVTAMDNSLQTTTSSPITLTVLPPNPVSFEVKGIASELSSNANGGIVTPTIAPVGMTGQAAILGTGSVTFSPAVSGDGVSFQPGGQQQTNTAFYKFTGPLIGQVFNLSQGDMTFYIKSNHDLASRASRQSVVMDVQDNSQVLLTFQTVGFVFYYQTGGGTQLNYTIPLAQQEALIGLGKILKVRLSWDGQHSTLFLNDALVSQQSYTPLTANWTANSVFTFGSETAFGGGFFSDDDVIADFQVTAPNPNQPWVTMTSPAGNAAFGPPAMIPLAASAGIGTGSIARVDFYQGATFLGSATQSPYSYTWTNVPLGTYNLSAKVTAASGATGVSSLVTVVVSNAPPPPPPPPPPNSGPTITSFTAGPSSITSGQSSTLSWTVTGASSLSINQGVGTVTGRTSISVSPAQTTTYTLTAANANGSVSQSVTVTVNATTGGARLPPPDLSNLPLYVPVNGTINLPTYPSQYGNVHLVWTFTPSAGRASGSPSVLVGARSAWAGAISPVSFQSPANTANLAGQNLAAGSYQVSVVAQDGQGNSSNPALANMTLVVSDLGQVKVYPNPWRKDKHAGKSVTFTNLPLGSTVKLFTISGHKVKELNDSSGTATWDLTNDSGDKVASGVYVYVITDGQGNKIKGKVAVIK